MYALVKDLPVGEYNVNENQDGFSGKGIISKKEFTGTLTVSADETAEIPTAAFVNNMVIEMTSASVKKVWKDDENRDGVRPTSLKVWLLADGEKIDYVILNSANNWVDRIDNLPKTKNGQGIAYTWQEEGITDYTLTNTAQTGTLTTLTNTHETKKTKVSVRKVWVDSGDHPASVKVQLYADGIAVPGKSVTLSAGNKWKHTWEDLELYAKPKGQSGGQQKIIYSVVETEIPKGYVMKIAGNAESGFVITNTKEKGRLVIQKSFDIREEEPPEENDETTEINVVKIWENDNDNKDGNRPGSITVHLFADGKEIKTAKLTAANGWKWTFSDLPKYVDERPINYAITEDPVKWYTTEIQGFTIRNKYTPETTSVSVKKVWHVNDPGKDTIPLSVRMTLSNGMNVVLNEGNGWTATITDLPAYVNGEPAVYTWTEQEIIGYELESVRQNGNMTTFTNKPWTRPDKPEKGKPPKNAGDTWYVFDEYDTPLGVEIVINHVGDCFD